MPSASVPITAENPHEQGCNGAGCPRQGRTSSSSRRSCAASSATICCEYVERLFGDEELIEFAVMDGIDEARAFDKIVPGKQKQPPRRSPHRMTRRPPVAEGCDQPRRTQLADEIDVADIDAEFEGRRGHHRLERSRLKALFRLNRSTREASMVSADLISAHPFGEVPRHAFS